MAPVVVPGGSTSGGGLALDSSHLSSNGAGAYSPKINGFSAAELPQPGVFRASKLSDKMEANKFSETRAARIKTAPQSKQRRKYNNSGAP